MTTRQVAIDLSLRNNFQAIPFLNSNLDPAVDTKPQPILPKVVWAINVVATAQGLRSANFALDLASPILSSANLNNALFRQIEVVDMAGNISYMLMDDTLGPSGERIYWLLNSDKTFQKFVSDEVPTALYYPIKHTMFQTRTIVLWTDGDTLHEGWTPTSYTPNLAFLEFNLVTRSVVFHEILGSEQWGFTAIGVASWGNYMLVYTLDRVFYSSPLDFKDFRPADGLAGSLRISEAQGPIQCIIPHSQGLLIYCRRNIVNATYSGDPVSPFILTEVPNSAGLLLYKGEPLVTRNEQSSFQVALTSEGLLFVSPNGCEPAPPELQALLGLEHVEVKAQGGVKVTRYFYPESSNTQYRYNKVRRLDLFGTKLFASMGTQAPGAGQEDYNRLFVYDIQTAEVTWIEGDIISVVPNLNLSMDMTAGRDFQNKLSNVMESYLLTKRAVLVGQPTYKNIILDFMNGTSTTAVPTAPFTFRKPEVMFSNISLRRGRYTEVWGVKLVGRFSDAEQDNAPDNATLATVVLYSETDDYTTPYTFVYEPASGKYVGYTVGKELRAIVQGQYLDLQEVVFDLALGGEDG